MSNSIGGFPDYTSKDLQRENSTSKDLQRASSLSESPSKLGAHFKEVGANKTDSKDQNSGHVRHETPPPLMRSHSVPLDVKYESELDKIALKRLTKLLKMTDSSQSNTQRIIDALQRNSKHSNAKIFAWSKDIAKDVPLGYKFDNNFDRGDQSKEASLKSVKVETCERLQSELRASSGKEDLTEASLKQFVEAYSTLSVSENYETHKRIYARNGINFIEVMNIEDRSSEAQVNQVASSIYQDLESTIDVKPTAKGPYVLSVLGNNSREGADINLSVFQEVVKQIENNPNEEQKNRYLSDFMSRVCFLCTGAAGKGTSLNFSVGKALNGLTPGLAKKLFTKTGEMKPLDKLPVTDDHTLTIQKNNLHPTKGDLKQLTKEDEVTIKFRETDDGIEGAVDLGNELQWFPVRKSGSNELPCLLFGSTEAEFNASVLGDQLILLNIQREKEGKTELIPALLVEPNSTDTGQNMKMGAAKVSGFCKSKGFSLKEAIVVQAQRMQQSARSGPTALVQFSTDGLGGPPAFKQIMNLDAQFSTLYSANQTAQSQAIDLINSLKEFANAVKYSLGDANGAFYPALEISPENFTNFMEITNTLMEGLKPEDDGAASDESHDITLKDALVFYGQLWPDLEGLIQQGSYKDLFQDLTKKHGTAVLSNLLNKTNEEVSNAWDKTKEIKNFVDELEGVEKEAYKGIQREVLTFTDGHRQRTNYLNENWENFKINPSDQFSAKMDNLRDKLIERGDIEDIDLELKELVKFAISDREFETRSSSGSTSDISEGSTFGSASSDSLESDL